MELFIVTEFKKLIPSLALIVLAIGGLVSANVNISQSKEIRELRSRIDIMEAYFPVEIPNRSWK